MTRAGKQFTQTYWVKPTDVAAQLEKAGFDLDWGDDGSGLFMKYLRRGSGYYIDVGASELVANGARERPAEASEVGEAPSKG